MSSKDQADFFTVLAGLEADYDAAKANLGPKGQTDPAATEAYQKAAQALADWRRDIKLLAGRPDIIDAPTGVS